MYEETMFILQSCINTKTSIYNFKYKIILKFHINTGFSLELYMKIMFILQSCINTKTTISCSLEESCWIGRWDSVQRHNWIKSGLVVGIACSGITGLREAALNALILISFGFF